MKKKLDLQMVSDNLMPIGSRWFIINIRICEDG